MATYKVDYQVITSLVETDIINGFIYDLSRLEFKQLYGDPERQLNGRCIKLVYKNGDYEIICQRLTEKYNKDNQIMYFSYGIFCIERVEKAQKEVKTFLSIDPNHKNLFVGINYSSGYNGEVLLLSLLIYLCWYYKIVLILLLQLLNMNHICKLDLCDFIIIF